MHDYETNNYTPVWNDRVLNYSDTVTPGTTAVWNGETNNLFNLIELAFADEKAAMMKRQLDAMVALSKSGSTTTLGKLYDYIHRYFFLNAQEYFPATAYNEDARISYEGGTIAYNEGRYSNDTHPITQSLGDHYLAEHRWITRRLVYMMSKYGYGLFAENGGDTIVFRASGNIIRYELTPAIDMYPTMGNGTTPVKGARTKAGEVCVIDIDLGDSADQQNTVYGVSWLLDIGDWHDKPVQGTMTVNGKMLNRLKLGDESDDITIAVSQLNIGDCVNVRVIDLRRIATLRGELNLAVCSHLRELYASGTQLTNILLPVGGGLEKIVYPATEQYIVLKNFVLLENSGVNYMDCAGNVTTFQVQECPAMNPFAMLVDIMKAQEAAGSEALRYVRCVGFDETFDSGGTLDYVAKLADTERYSGLNADGVATADTRVPVLEGRLTVNGYAYEDSVRALEAVFDPTKLEIIVKGYWVRFADPEVLRVLLENFDTDKDGGLNQAEVDAITSLRTIFSRNTKIVTFNELSRLNMEELTNGGFTGCTNLESVDCSNFTAISGTNGYQRWNFEDCSKLKQVGLSSKCTRIGWMAFNGCAALTESGLGDISNVEGHLYYRAFWHCAALESLSLQKITSIDDYAFSGCSSLKSIMIDNAMEIGAYSFENCTALERIKINVRQWPTKLFSRCTALTTIIQGEQIEEIAESALDLCPSLSVIVIKAKTPPTFSVGWYKTTANIYVPDQSVDRYKAASGWNTYSNQIKPLSEYVEET